jgi:hypothetical protein
MSAVAMFMKGERAVADGSLSARAQELEGVVSRFLPMFYKRDFRFLGKPHSTIVDSAFDIPRHTSSPCFPAANGFNSLLQRQGTMANGNPLAIARFGTSAICSGFPLPTRRHGAR